ncbi:SCAN domain-containing protein 3 [Trichinella nativa]|uniref:SCAN domain-containing protein 3 n=1 Tax=Trichinella nativa TaxID=6335 RepID=A0A0V1L696_9BILA|nr:SCAN domain-containing protein 3 [Trichinella nativa]
MSSIPTTGKYSLTTTLPELRRLFSCHSATYDKIVYDLLRIQAKGTSSAEDHNLNRRFGLFIRCFPSLGIPIRVLVTWRKENVFGDKKEMGQRYIGDMQNLHKIFKFCFLRPLTSKSSEEVAHNLFDVFLLIGAPAILQSDSGREFGSSLIAELKCLWPETNFI